MFPRGKPYRGFSLANSFARTEALLLYLLGALNERKRFARHNS